MTQPDPRIVDRIFSEALELSGDERAAFIDAQCGEDGAIRDRVLSLVAAADAPADEFDSRFSLVRDRLLGEVIGADASEQSEDLSGLRINNWRLEKRLARGGLATVYIAHRDDGEYDQRAAFKVLRRGLDTDDLVARFRAERQILSSLDHPAIAGILDGGALEDGRPYLVLEFVDGVPITEYCESNKVSVEKRVRLMLEVLRALHHAHRHLIVHRDIKPSNILVSNDGHVALLDFGIAKLLDPGALPGASTLTRTGMSLMTPGYCSPEQAAREAVTTASDIYQAGAVLYELLTGSRPRLASTEAGSVDMPLPSASLKGRADYSAVRGDLDAIVRKATHADPAQRYASADEMEADLKRYLDGRPVLAQPDTLAYRLRKLHKRRPWAAPVVVIATVAVAGYLYTLVAYNEQLRVEERRASAAQAFMIDILSSPDPFRPADPELGSSITVIEALDLGAERLNNELRDDPELKASILSSIARVYASLDEHRKAISLREQALDIQRDVYGETSEPVQASLQMLANEYLNLNNYERAERYSNEHLAVARQLYGEEEPRLGEAEAAAAEVASSLGEFEAAKALFESGIVRMRHDRAGSSQPLTNALIALADLNQYDDSQKAAELLAEAQALVEEFFGSDSLSMALVRSQLATLLSATEQYEAAEKEFNAAIPIYELKLGLNHGSTLSAVNNLAILYNRMGQYGKAERIYRQVLERYMEKYGAEHRTVGDSYQNLATAITRAGRYTESIPMHERAFEIYRSVLPRDQPVVAYPLLSKAYAEVNDGQWNAAETSGRAALTIVEETTEGSYLVGVARCLIGRSLEGQGRDAEAAAFMAEAHELLIGSVVSDTYSEFCRVPVR